MIIFRYLARNVISNTLGVSAVLLLVVVSGRFVKYLAEAASGKLDASILIAVIGFRLPGFLELVIPLAFFLSIMLAYGQLYVDSEMSVLQACGFSQQRLLGYTLIVAVLMAIVVGSLSLLFSPSGFTRVQELFNAQKQRSELETLTPGKFYKLRAGRGVTYTESIGDDGTLSNVFLAQEVGNQAEGRVVVVADRGQSQTARSTGERYLVLERGQRIQGIPGRADFQVTRFEVFGQRLQKALPDSLYSDIDAVPTRVLLNSPSPEYKSALLWRASLPLMVIIVAMIAVPLSKTNPRQGRFARILPAVLLYVIYLLLLNAARGLVGDGYSPAVVGAVHLIFLAVALALVARVSGWRFFGGR